MTNELSPENDHAIQNAIFAGNKIEAIKLYRTVTGMDLKDSKEAVEKLTEKLEAQEPAKFASSLLKKDFVTPAQAGVQELKAMLSSTSWIPACAGMTEFDVSVRFSTNC